MFRGNVVVTDFLVDITEVILIIGECRPGQRPIPFNYMQLYIRNNQSMRSVINKHSKLLFCTAGF